MWLQRLRGESNEETMKKHEAASHSSERSSEYIENWASCYGTKKWVRLTHTTTPVCVGELKLPASSVFPVSNVHWLSEVSSFKGSQYIVEGAHDTLYKRSWLLGEGWRRLRYIRWQKSLDAGSRPPPQASLGLDPTGTSSQMLSWNAVLIRHL